MTHTARKRSESTFYHVVTKGSGNQIIFEDPWDRTRYLELLEETVESFRVQVHSYCLMSNHVHLLLRDTAEELSPFMKQLNERYAMRFAKKSGRVGNVFQVPFWSEPIENESYYLSALRYIHANPEAANICLASEYPWSSYGAYTGDSTFVTTEFALELLGGVERFVEFSANGSKYPVAFPKSKLRNHLSADELWHVASKVVGREAILRMRSMKPIERQPYIDQLVSVGFAGYEICRVTGLGRNIVQRAMANHE